MPRRGSVRVERMVRPMLITDGTPKFIAIEERQEPTHDGTKEDVDHGDAEASENEAAENDEARYCAENCTTPNANCLVGGIQLFGLKVHVA